MPLHGKAILTTRAAAQRADLRDRLAALGARVVECPAIEIVPVEDWTEVDGAIKALHSYQWLLFTSANAVDAFFERAKNLGAVCTAPIAVVGPATAARLAQWKMPTALVPTSFHAEGLLATFPEDLSGARILFPRAETAREILPDELRRRGAAVDILTVYRTVKGSGVEDIREVLSREAISCVVFTSSSTVRFLAEALGGDLRLLEQIPLAVIGPVTRRTAESFGLRPAIEPAESTTAALVDAIDRYFRTER